MGTFFGSVIGLLIATLKTIPTAKSFIVVFFQKILNGIFSIYITVFRGTPMIVQAMVIYYGSAQALGLNINRTLAGVIIISLNTGAYMSEIIRSGIHSISGGQSDAAKTLGLSYFSTMTYIIIPQVLRNVLPILGNTLIMNIKDTSVLNVISITEIFFQAKSIAGSNFRYFESFFVATLIYLIMTIGATIILNFIEKKTAISNNQF